MAIDSRTEEQVARIAITNTEVQTAICFNNHTGVMKKKGGRLFCRSVKFGCGVGCGKDGGEGIGI